ncbi:MAG TPA: nuclear transport factor 2 family protein [Polyangia bacterium]|nr:nuclear transport factor 2 family protein [Polyangia bacterium]
MANAHPNEELLRRAYRLFADGNIAAFTQLCSPDIRFKVPGTTPVSGEHALGEFMTRLGAAMQRIDNSFRETVVHLAANDTNGFVLAAQSVNRDGETLRWNAVHRWEIAAGKLTHFWEFTDDETTFDRAWAG